MCFSFIDELENGKLSCHESFDLFGDYSDVIELIRPVAFICQKY